MEKWKKVGVTGAITVLSILAVVSAGFLSIGGAGDVQSLADEYTAHGHPYAVIHHNDPEMRAKYGEWEFRGIDNTITRIGINHTVDCLMNVIANGTLTTFALSNGSTSPATTDTACEATVITNKGLAPANVSNANIMRVFDQAWADADTANVSLSHVWTATGQSDSISKVCLYNISYDAGKLYASGLLNPVVNMGNTDTLNVTYYIALTG